MSASPTALFVPATACLACGIDTMPSVSHNHGQGSFHGQCCPHPVCLRVAG